MRRAFSMLLAIAVGLIVGLGPAMAEMPANAPRSGWSGQEKPVDESHLPACCRRNGAHRCAMHALGAASAQTTLSAAGCCPCWPRTMASAVEAFAAIPAAAMQLAHSVELRSPHAAVIAAGISQRRSWPKRGPPTAQTLSI